jgi:hypothetical protein
VREDGRIVDGEEQKKKVYTREEWMKKVCILLVLVAYGYYDARFRKRKVQIRSVPSKRLLMCWTLQDGRAFHRKSSSKAKSLQ